MFSHLHVHSHYSLLDGLPKIDELIQKAKDYNMQTLALTDHGVMYGVVEFYQKAKSAGIKPIIGVEVYLAPFGRHSRRVKIDEKRYHLILLAKNKAGYENLIKLTTKAHLEGFYYKPRVDWELLEKYSQSLIALTGCIKGEIPQSIIEDKIDQAEKLIKKYQSLFGQENFYLEVQRHPSIPDYEKVNQVFFDWNKKYGLPVVATNDIHYLDKQDDQAQDILLCLQTKKKKEDKKRLCMLGADFSFRSPVQMAQDFKNHPEALENTQRIAEACNLEIELGKTKLPHFEIPNGKSADEYLEELCYQGLEKRYECHPGGNERTPLFWKKCGGSERLIGSHRYPVTTITAKTVSDIERDSIASSQASTSFQLGTLLQNDKRILDRLKYELSTIERTGFATYFLIVQDFVNWAKNQNIVVGPGRGSAPGSLVSYLLNITDVDPLKYDLLFERFLNPERISMPDIDLDFADDRRDEVIKYIEKKYGHDHVAQIATFGTMAARQAIRDVGRVQGFPYSFPDKIAKMIPFGRTIEEALKIVPELKEVYENDTQAKVLLETSKKLEGVARHISTHACGLVITKETLDLYLPLQHPTQDDETIVTQFTMGIVEALGLLKIDILGLRNLTVLQNALELIKQNQGNEINLNKIPLDDKKTFDIFQEGKTTGLFQFESSGMKRNLKQLKPNQIEDLIAMVALYRPGPMEWIKDYIAGKRRERKIFYLHPRLKPILEKTHGIAIYQEQVMEIAKQLAGFTLPEADILRKAVGKKIRRLLKAQREKFIQGCVNNNISKNISEEIFTFIIEPFAGYGFNRSHAVSYALIGYWTAYLKANWPSEFMAALLTSDQGDTDRIAVEVEETRQMGIEILPPDVNESFENFTVVQ